MYGAREQMLLHYLNKLPGEPAIEMAERAPQCLCCFHAAASNCGPVSRSLVGKQYLFLLAWNKGVCDQ